MAYLLACHLTVGHKCQFDIDDIVCELSTIEDACGTRIIVGQDVLEQGVSDLVRQCECKHRYATSVSSFVHQVSSRAFAQVSNLKARFFTPFRRAPNFTCSMKRSFSALRKKTFVLLSMTLTKLEYCTCLAALTSIIL